MRRLICWILGVMLSFSCAGTEASPGVVCQSAGMRLVLRTDKVFVAPFDRWFSQLAYLTDITLERAEWDAGEAVRVRVVMGEQPALTLEVLRDQNQLFLKTDLSPDAYRLDPSANWALLLLERARMLNSMPSSGFSLPVSDTRVASAFAAGATELRAWASLSDNAEHKQQCEAAAVFLDGLSDAYENSEIGNALLITLSVRESAYQPQIPQSALPASAGFPAPLLKSAAISVFQSTAANDPSILE